MTDTTRADEILENISAELEDITAGFTACADGFMELSKLGYLDLVITALPKLTSATMATNEFVKSIAVGCIKQGQPTPPPPGVASLIDLAKSSGLSGNKQPLIDGMRREGLIE